MDKSIRIYKKYREYILLIGIFQLLVILFGLFLISMGSNNSLEVIELVHNTYSEESFGDIFRILIITPIYEESIYRMVIYGLLSKVLSRKKAVIISAILFAVGHKSSTIIQAFFVGIIFCEIFILSNKIIYPILLHSFANGIYLFLNYGKLNILAIIVSSKILITFLFVGVLILFYKIWRKYNDKREHLYEKIS